jgi:hypothetical protein
MALNASTVSPAELLNEDQAAEFLGLCKRTLQLWRASDSCPIPYIRLGLRKIRYAKSDLAGWVEAQRFTSLKSEGRARKANSRRKG